MNRALYMLVAVLTPVTVCLAASPSTQPGSISGSTILVLPIEPPSGSYGWVGRAIQQDLLVDLTQMTRAHVIAPASPLAADNDAALRAGRDAGANYVVFGTAQSSGAQLRVTGQVLDAATGQTLTNLKATAPMDDLFPLEDALAIQAARSLPGVNMPATAPAGSAPQPLPTIINQQPYVSEATPAPQYEYGPDYGYGPYVYGPYPYDYPGYYYPGYLGLGFVGPGIIIGGHHFHDHDFGHGFDHRNFVSPHVNPGVFSHGFSGRGGFRSSGGFGGGRSFGGGGGGHMGGGGRGR